MIRLILALSSVLVCFVWPQMASTWRQFSTKHPLICLMAMGAAIGFALILVVISASGTGGEFVYANF